MGFKENLRDELAYRGLMIKELAALSNLNQHSLSNYLRENSSVPSADVAVKIAKALGVTVEYLVTGKTTTPKNLQEKNAVNKYAPDIKKMAEKLSKISLRDRKHIAALIDSILAD